MGMARCLGLGSSEERGYCAQRELLREEPCDEQEGLFTLLIWCLKVTIFTPLDNTQIDWYTDFYYPFLNKWADTVRKASQSEKMVFVEAIPNEVSCSVLLHLLN